MLYIYIYCIIYIFVYVFCIISFISSGYGRLARRGFVGRLALGRGLLRLLFGAVALAGMGICLLIAHSSITHKDN